MPRLTDSIPLADKFLDKRVKLLECQKEMVIYWTNQGMSQRSLARMFNVSRRLIMFIQDPEKRINNYKTRVAAGGSKQYYVKEEHTEAIRTHRNYKKDIFNQFNVKAK